MRTAIALIVLLFTTLVVPTSAAAQRTFYDGLKSVHLHTVDQVKDGCWPRPNETEREVELELLRSQLSVKKGFPRFEKGSRAYIELLAIGSEETYGSGRPSGTCTVGYSLRFGDCPERLKTSYGAYPAFPCVHLWNLGGVVGDAKEKMQTLLNDQLLRAVRKFLYKLEKARLAAKKQKESSENLVDQIMKSEKNKK